MICDRCGRKATITTMSMFNEQTICMECKKREEEHPEYEHARRTEGEAVLRGDYNFPGIGLPDDLKEDT